MKSKYALFIISIICLSTTNKSLAQSVFFDLDSLNQIQLKYKIAQSFPKQYKDSLICERLYNIPDSIILNAFPFDADSIVVAVPNLGKDSYEDVYCDFDKPGRYPVISKMTPKDIVEFANNIYNYDFTGSYSIYYSSVDKNNPPHSDIYQFETTVEDMVVHTSLSMATPPTIPNIILLFYYYNKINYIGLYFDIKESQVRIATSFLEPTKLYLGEYCPDRYLRLGNFFKSKYNINIVEFENYDYGIPLLPLIENQKLDN